MDLVAAASSAPFFPVVALQPMAASNWSSCESDPLGADESDDRPVVTTERRLRRLAIVAADTGARFEREGIGHDPMAWLLAPRTVFDRARPIDACQTRGGFLRAAVLNGLSLGLDADPAVVDALIDDDEGKAAHAGDGCSASVALSSSDEDPQRFTCFLEDVEWLGGGRALCVLGARSHEHVQQRLLDLYGAVVGRSTVCEGVALPEQLGGDSHLGAFLRVLSCLSAGIVGASACDLRIELRLTS